MDWWRDVGPQVFPTNEVYLRTAVSVDAGGWAQFGHVRMPDYRWGIFLADKEEGRVIPGGDHAGQPVWQEVPGEHRNALKRIIVVQADTEPASVEQQRWLARTAPSLYDARNLFQVNVEEGRHLWAMVYLLHAHFGRDGRDEADALLQRRSGNDDSPRILDAFNQPCRDWLTFFSFTTFTDRDGKYQLGSLAESAFDPLSRTCRFMLTKEAHHMFVGETGMERVLERTAELTRASKNGDARELGGIDFQTIQKWVNFWYTYSLDLFGAEISTNAADYFAAGIKGRWQEARKYEDHLALGQARGVPVVEDGRLVEREVALRNAMNECLRDEYVDDCERVVKKWNSALENLDADFRIELPNRRFHRHQGLYAGLHFNPQGEIITAAEFAANKDRWLPTPEDRAYVESLMVGVHEPGKVANWIAAPKRGINRMPVNYEYVRLDS